MTTNGGKGGFTFTVRAKLLGCTASVVSDSGDKSAENNAGRLIASAPDLLEALKWVAGHSYAGEKSFGEVEIVRAAIARAEGEG